MTSSRGQILGFIWVEVTYQSSIENCHIIVCSGAFENLFVAEFKFIVFVVFCAVFVGGGMPILDHNLFWTKPYYLLRYGPI